jgi:hypothetical protein
MNISGKWFRAIAYGVRPDDHRVDMKEVERLAREHRPKLIIAGGSAYSRILDFAGIPAYRRPGRRATDGRHGALRRTWSPAALIRRPSPTPMS